MSADPYIYCLEQVTDYAAFETMCAELMEAAGFTGIEPIGGTGDRGRDAVWSGRAGNDSVVFAFSTRADWESKLYEDCQRVHECGHQVVKLVFVSSRHAQAQARDRAIEQVLSRFGWRLDLYDVRRIRLILTGDGRSVLANHPSIFGPPWFDTRGGLLIDGARDTLIVDHLECDHAFATWLSRRLELAGHRVWCHGIAPLVGEDAHDTIGQLIATRALRYLPVLSAQSVKDRNLLDRCARATSASELKTLPCIATEVEDAALGDQLRRTEPARFDTSWAEGLRKLSQALEASGVRPNGKEASHVVTSLLSRGPVVVKDEPEAVYANVFAAAVPQAIYVFELSEDVSDVKIEELRRTWAFERVHGRTLLAFERPPGSIDLPLLDRIPNQYAWMRIPDMHGRSSVGVVERLTRRTLEVACGRAGLAWCGERKEYHVPPTETGRYGFRHVNGERRNVSLAGYRDRNRLSYQLAPRFFVRADDDSQVWVTLRIYIRLVGEDGALVPSASITKRRKKVTRQWWNKDWLARTLAMMQRISQGEATIGVGQGAERVSVDTVPVRLACPLAIDAQAMDELADLQREFAMLRGDGDGRGDDMLDTGGDTDGR